jgi:hypothetical protein
MNPMQKIQHRFLMIQHRKMVEAYGEHPEQNSTPFSAGADAIQRLAEIDAESGAK